MWILCREVGTAPEPPAEEVWGQHWGVHSTWAGMGVRLKGGGWVGGVLRALETCVHTSGELLRV